LRLPVTKILSFRSDDINQEVLHEI
jgi:hypothetical protein